MSVATTWRWVGDRAVLRAFPDGSLDAANAAALALYRELRSAALAETEDLVPGARSLLVVLKAGTEPSPRLLAALDAGASISGSGGEAPAPLHKIEVQYGGEAGVDLPEVARLHGMTEADIVEVHAEGTYTVGFLGFMPGFGYLLGLPPALATPRLATPRTRVPAGSVAIGGEFTGIYPRATPGGWRIIGRTEVDLFDPRCDPPALFSPGDRVRFVPR
jgi:KipI family sensor histidine kinase inhibitor